MILAGFYAFYNNSPPMKHSFIQPCKAQPQT